jgi:hypothetical protein
MFGLVLAGCAKSGEAVKSPVEKEQASARREVRRAVDRLRDDVAQMERSPALDQRDLVVALRHAADALAALPERDALDPRILNIETYADRIAQSAPGAKQQASWARSGLMEGAATLEQVARARGRTDMEPWLRAIRARAEAIDPDKSIVEQHHQLVTGFDELAEATAYLGAQKPPEAAPQG